MRILLPSIFIKIIVVVGQGPSDQMSYIHEGCFEEDGFWWVRKAGIGTWDITFKYEEDMLNVNIVQSNSKITNASIGGKRIYELTNGGSTSLVIMIFLNSTDDIDISFAYP